MRELLDLISQPSGAAIMQNITGLPVIAGLLLFLIPEKVRLLKELLALAVALLTGLMATAVFSWQGSISVLNTGAYSDFLTLNIDKLSRLILLLISCFSILIIIYSIVYNRYSRVSNFYSWLLITLGCSNGAVISDNLILFLVFWGILGITLYKMLPGKDEESSAAAKKTLILIGASDSIMIIGIAIIWRITGTLNMSEISLGTGDVVRAFAFFALVTGSFTKAGAFPFHTWVPDFAKEAPAQSSAYLPASLDKLLGIYFLARILNDLFIPGELIKIILLATGVITIITAVLMALIQHDYKQLLGYHAVSQVGYMVLGLSLGSALGLAAGLFHMINHAIYKSGLFLAAGAVDYRTGKRYIDDLGGLARSMPLTFASSLVFALSISGVPPFNGFASKWMIYQAIVDFGAGQGLASSLWVLWLGLAVAGSALTLASFIKFIGGIFLGKRNENLQNIREVPLCMSFPLTVLALTCVLFGVFATSIVVPRLVIPAAGTFEFTGFWSSGLVSLLVLISLLLGTGLYFLLKAGKMRQEDSFIGGEKFYDQAHYPAPEYYKSIMEFKFFSWVYAKAQDKWFDIYDLSKNIVLWFSHKLSGLHSGLLTGYILWVFAGLIIMLLVML